MTVLHILVHVLPHSRPEIVPSQQFQYLCPSWVSRGGSIIGLTQHVELEVVISWDVETSSEVEVALFFEALGERENLAALCTRPEQGENFVGQLVNDVCGSE